MNRFHITQVHHRQKGRLKRGGTIHQSRTLKQWHWDFLDLDWKEIPRCFAVPAWNEGASTSHLLLFRVLSPMLVRKIPKGALGKSTSQLNTFRGTPKDSWIHVCCDGSAESTSWNGGVGIYAYVQWSGGKKRMNWLCCWLVLYKSQW